MTLCSRQNDTLEYEAKYCLLTVNFFITKKASCSHSQLSNLVDPSLLFHESWIWLCSYFSSGQKWPLEENTVWLKLLHLTLLSHLRVPAGFPSSAAKPEGALSWRTWPTSTVNGHSGYRLNVAENKISKSCVIWMSHPQHHFNIHACFHCAALLADTSEATKISTLLEKRSNEFLTYVKSSVASYSHFFLKWYEKTPYH